MKGVLRKLVIICLVIVIASLLFGIWNWLAEEALTPTGKEDEGLRGFGGIIFVLLSFPMMFFDFGLFDWLKHYWGDNNVMFLFIGINSIFWSVIIYCILSKIYKFIKMSSLSSQHQSA